MGELPKFKKDNPANDEEKMITELFNVLDDATWDFIKKSFKMDKDISLDHLQILRDGIINHCGKWIVRMSYLFQNEGVDGFINESKELFDDCLKENRKN